MTRAAPAERDADVVVIGAGIGGLVAASRLAAGTLQTVCVEARARPGGWWSSIEEDGFVVDLGPPVLLDPEGLEEVFLALGTRLRNHVGLLETDPFLGVVFPDWERVVLHRSAERTAQELERFGEGDGDRYLEMLSYLGSASDDLRELERKAAHTSFHSLFSKAVMRRPVFAMQSLSGFLASALRGVRARAALGAWPLLTGESPATVPAADAVLLHRIHSAGAFQVKGGAVRLGSALARIAQDAGVSLRLGAPVAQIDVEAGRVVGVRLESGERISARAVVSNVNGIGTYLDLLPPGTLAGRAVRRLRRYDLQAAACQVAVGFDGPDQPDLALQCYVPPPMELGDALSALRASGDVYTKGLPMAMACPTVADPSVAPDETSLVRVLVPVPHRQTLGDWRKLRTRVEREVVLLADSRFFPRLASRVVWQGIFTPQTLAGMFGLHRRSVAPAMSPGQRGSGRLAARSPWIGGLYLAGASTHPGIGTTRSARSGLIAAELVLEDLS